MAYTSIDSVGYKGSMTPGFDFSLAGSNCEKANLDQTGNQQENTNNNKQEIFEDNNDIIPSFRKMDHPIQTEGRHEVKTEDVIVPTAKLKVNEESSSEGEYLEHHELDYKKKKLLEEDARRDSNAVWEKVHGFGVADCQMNGEVHIERVAKNRALEQTLKSVERQNSDAIWEKVTGFDNYQSENKVTAEIEEEVIKIAPAPKPQQNPSNFAVKNFGPPPHRVNTDYIDPNDYEGGSTKIIEVGMSGKHKTSGSDIWCNLNMEQPDSAIPNFDPKAIKKCIETEEHRQLLVDYESRKHKLLESPVMSNKLIQFPQMNEISKQNRSQFNYEHVHPQPNRTLVGTTIDSSPVEDLGNKKPTNVRKKYRPLHKRY